ncbi:MAG: hypothetical protein M3033_13370 [Acidobacteriota bacterium]|nr:hypothetical protein [Acidobacteriota bacterium]
MKNIILLFLFASCSGSTNLNNSNFAPAQNKINSAETQNINSDKPKTWQVVKSINERTVKGRIAIVEAVGKSSDAEIETLFKIQCPTKQLSITELEFTFRNTNKLKTFSFDDFEGPDAPNLKKKLVEFRVDSPQKKMSWLAIGTGGYGGNGEPNAFFISPATTNKPDRTEEIARIIADGNAQITIVVHDGKDYKKTLEATFPAIEISSDTAKYLNGCRP